MELIEWVEGDLTDYVSLTEALQGIENVFNCAGKVSFSESDKKELYKVNASGVANLVNACLDSNIKKLCHVSSIATLGIPEEEDQMINELLPWNHAIKHSSYAHSKYNGEMEIWRGIAEGLNAVIINPSVILGPGSWEKGTPHFFSMVWNGMKFFTEGVTGFVDVRDVVEVMRFLMSNDISNERFIVSSENLSYKQFFSEIAESLGKKPPYVSASKYLLGLSWRMDYIISKVLLKKPKLTRNTVKTAMDKQHYSSRKLIDATNIDFIHVKESINNVAKAFLKDYLK